MHVCLLHSITYKGKNGIYMVVCLKGFLKTANSYFFKTPPPPHNQKKLLRSLLNIIVTKVNRV